VEQLLGDKFVSGPVAIVGRACVILLDTRRFSRHDHSSRRRDTSGLLREL
jgi:hypothetical protein